MSRFRVGPVHPQSGRAGCSPDRKARPRHIERRRLDRFRSKFERCDAGPNRMIGRPPVQRVGQFSRPRPIRDPGGRIDLPCQSTASARTVAVLVWFRSARHTMLFNTCSDMIFVPPPFPIC